MYGTKAPGQDWEWHEGEPDYDTLVECVGGYLEALSAQWGIVLWMDEEGKLKGRAPNLLMKSGGSVTDVVVGTVVATRADNLGEVASLRVEDTDYLQTLPLWPFNGGEVLPALSYM